MKDIKKNMKRAQTYYGLVIKKIK